MKSRSKNTWFRCPSLKASELRFVLVVLDREAALNYVGFMLESFPVVELLRDPYSFLRSLAPSWLNPFYEGPIAKYTTRLSEAPTWARTFLS